MSPIKEITIKMIQEIPDDKVVYILHIIKGINGLYKDLSTPSESKRNALAQLQQFRGRIPADLDYAEELEKSRVEGYARSHWHQCGAGLSGEA